jgi:hypothetical protein
MGASGGIVGGTDDNSSEKVWGPPEQGAADAAWSWRELPAMSTGRYGSCGCVMSDGRFAVLCGKSYYNGDTTSSCEALVAYGDAPREPLLPMHDARDGFACGAVAGCVIIAGGRGLKSDELYNEERNRWLRLPFDLPYVGGLVAMGSAAM